MSSHHIVKAQPPRRVFVALNLGENAGRRILSGILRFANSGCRWHLNIANDFSAINADFVRHVLLPNFDGVIGGLPELSKCFSSLLKSPLPFALNVTPERLPIPASEVQQSVFVDVDNAAIGRTAYDYFSNRGKFLSVAFASDRAERKWSMEREETFVKCWAGKGVKVHTFKLPSDDRPLDTAQLDAFLISLPKPAAIWCVYDITAVAVLEACIRCKIKVPEQIAILGTDNDETLCRYATPTLSSIELPQEHLGFLAAQELDRLMSKRNRPHRTILMGKGESKVVERDSSRHIPPATHLITEAHSFIMARACYGVSINDVVKHLGVSRSLLDLRFRQIENKSIGRVIQEARIHEIKRLLRYSDSSMSHIATRCGFSSLPRLAHFFKRETGLSMGEYRKSSAMGAKSVRYE